MKSILLALLLLNTPHKDPGDVVKLTDSSVKVKGVKVDFEALRKERRNGLLKATLTMAEKFKEDFGEIKGTPYWPNRGKADAPEIVPVLFTSKGTSFILIFMWDGNPAENHYQVVPDDFTIEPEKI